jgi:hypothetical protein
VAGAERCWVCGAAIPADREGASAHIVRAELGRGLLPPSVVKVLLAVLLALFVFCAGVFCL